MGYPARFIDEIKHAVDQVVNNISKPQFLFWRLLPYIKSKGILTLKFFLNTAMKSSNLDCLSIIFKNFKSASVFPAGDRMSAGLASPRDQQISM